MLFRRNRPVGRFGIVRRWDCTQKNLLGTSPEPVPPAPPAPPAPGWRGTMKLYSELGKPRLSALVVLTTMFGYSVAPGPFVLADFLSSSAGTACFAVAASCVNQIVERDLDAKMVRTRCRPLPMRTLSVAQASGLCLGATVAGTALLSWSPIGLALGLSNVVLYGFVYTPLKQRTTLNTPIGAIVGAIPPAIGYLAGGGGLDFGLAGLVGLLYAWQMPHFHSLSFNLKEDYRRGNYKMLVLEPDGEQKVSRTITMHTLALVPLGAFFWMADITDASFMLTSLLPVAWFWHNVRGFAANPTSHSHAKAVFLTSVRFLPVYLLLLLAHHLWHEHQKAKKMEMKQ